VPHWVHALPHWAQWGTVPAFLTLVLGVWQFRSSRKDKQEAQARAEAAAREAQIAEDNATWRIEWENKMWPTLEDDKGHYDLLNKSSAAKYGVSVEGRDGTEGWKQIDKGKSKALNSAYKPQRDQPTGEPQFKLSWYVTSDLDGPIHSCTVWGQ
jgi:hypothetical protein